MARKTDDDDVLGEGGDGRRLSRNDNQRGGMQPNSAEAKHLLSFVERIERLNEDKKQVGEDIKDVYAEAKGTGYDVKVIRKVIGIRKADKDKRREEEEMLGLYLAALGME